MAKKQRQGSSVNGASIKATMEDLVAALGTVGQPGMLTYALNVRGPGRVMHQLGRLARDIRIELTTYNEEVGKLAERCGATKLGTESSGLRYVFFKDPKNPTEGETKVWQEFQKQQQDILKTEITLHHRQMPELLDIVQFTADETEALAWLLGPGASQ